MIAADGGWVCFGAGLDARRTFGRLEASIEGQLLRLDAPGKDDLRHGVAARAAATLDYGFTVSRWATFDWRLGPEVGVSTAVLYGAGPMHRTENEWFGGLRASYRVIVDGARASGRARGFGSHVSVRVGRSNGLTLVNATIGYDWGL
jgi:hypothetical protein